MPAQTKAPVRLAFLYVPNGIDMKNWNVPQEGAFGELPRVMKPLDAFRGDMIQIGNLTNNSGRALLDGLAITAGAPGRTSPASRSRRPRSTSRPASRAIRSSPTRSATRRASPRSSSAWTTRARLATATPAIRVRTPTTWRGAAKRSRCRRCSTRGSCSSACSARASSTAPRRPTVARGYRRSILDFVTSDTKKLQTSLGPTDKRKLEEYLSSIREVERQLEKAEKDSLAVNPGMDKPYGVPPDFAEHFKLMSDMMTIAFQADMTRVLTFMMTREGTSRSYREIGIADGHHPCTHHQGKPDLMEKVTQINEYHTAQLAGWLGRLKAIREGDCSLLDNMMIVYGAGLSDGNRHLHEDLPTLLIGRGGNHVKPGRRIIYRKETPMSNFHLTLMDRMGVPMENFGDASGHLDPASLT